MWGSEGVGERERERGEVFFWGTSLPFFFGGQMWGSGRCRGCMEHVGRALLLWMVVCVVSEVGVVEGGPLDEHFEVDEWVGKYVYDVISCDLDGRWGPDLVVLWAPNGYVGGGDPWVGMMVSGIYAAPGRGLGNLTGEVLYGPVDDVEEVACGDVDGDGKDDVVVTSDSYVTGMVWVGELSGWGVPNIISAWYSRSNPVKGLVVGDVDGDGAQDVIDTTVIWWNENGAGTVWSDVPYATGSFIPKEQIVLIDPKGTGVMDVVGASFFGLYYYSQSAGRTWTERPINSGAGGDVVAVGDWDGDSRPDIIASNSNDGISAFINPGGADPAAAFPWSEQVIVTISAFLSLDIEDIVLGDVDGDGGLDVVLKVVLGQTVYGAWIKRGVPSLTYFTNGPEGGYNPSRRITVMDVDSFSGADVIMCWDQPGRYGLRIYPSNLPNGRDVVFGPDLAAETSFSGLIEASAGVSTAVYVRAPNGYPLGVWGVEVWKSFPTSPVPIPDQALSLVAIPGAAADSHYSVEVLFDDPVVAEVHATWYGTRVGNSPLTFQVTPLCLPGEKVSGLQCYPCEGGSYWVPETVRECTPCPSFTFSAPGSVSYLNCTCQAGTWSGPTARTPSSPCIACPDGASCSGGEEAPRALPGRFDVGEAEFATCFRKGCLAGNVCKPGYSGYLCGTCEKGYYSSSPQECTRCPAARGMFQGGAIILYVLVGLLLVGAIMATAMSGGQSGEEEEQSEEERMAAFRARKKPASLSMIALCFQIVALLVEQSGFAWPKVVSSSLGVLRILNMDSRAVGAECELGSWHSEYLLRVALPVGLVVFVLLVLLVLRCVRRFAARLRSMSLGALVDTVFFTVGPMVYIPMTKNTIEVFDCMRLPNGDVVLDSDNGVACFDSAWMSSATVGVIATFVFIIGLPAYVSSTLNSRKAMLYTPAAMKQCGALYRPYRRALYWFELVNLMKKLVVVLVAVFFSRQPLIQVAALLVALNASLGLSLRYRPYFHPVYNGIDARLQMVLVALVLLGAGYHAERAHSRSSPGFVVVFVALFVGLIGIACHSVVIDMLGVRKEKNEDDDTMYDAERKAEVVRVVEAGMKEAWFSQETKDAAQELIDLLEAAKREGLGLDQVWGEGLGLEEGGEEGVMMDGGGTGGGGVGGLGALGHVSFSSSGSESETSSSYI